MGCDDSDFFLVKSCQNALPTPPPTTITTTLDFARKEPNKSRNTQIWNN